MTTRSTKKLGEISQIKTGRKDANFGTPDGEYPFFTCGEKILKAPDYSFDTEAILVAGNGDVGACKYYKGKFEAYQRTYVIDKFIDADPFYLFYYLDGFLGIKAKQEMLGSAIPYIKLGMLQNFEIPLPPLDIQKAIVTKLDEAFAEIDEAISLTEGNISKTEEFKKSVLDKVFEDGEWKNKKMGDKKVLEIVDGDRGNNYPKKDEFLEDGYCLFLNTGNVRQGFFDLKDKQFITKEKDALLRKGKVKLDDVILTTRGTIGNSAHYDKNIEYTNVRINSGMVLLRSNKEVLMPEYLLKFITTPFFHKQRLAMASGSAQPQLPIGTLNNIEIPLPPLEDQAKIISYLDQVFAETSALKSDYETKLTHLKELKASILQSAFEGKLIAE